MIAKRAGALRHDRRRKLQFAPGGTWPLVGAAVATMALADTMLPKHRLLLLWNVSESSPRGLYAVLPPGRVTRGDFAIAWPPPTARKLASARNYLPSSVPMVKTVAAVPGDRVCAIGTTLLINGSNATRRLRADPSGRRLPWWTGCRTLNREERLLLSASAPLGFDGRYFGPTRQRDIVGKGILLWPN